MDFGQKRLRPDVAFSRNGNIKRSKEELESYTPGAGGKSKPCTKYFSVSGCPFGETCHFLHYSPGYSAQLQLANAGGNSFIPFNDAPPPSVLKTKICNRISTPEGCRFGEKCNFAHSQMEIGSRTPQPYEDTRSGRPFSDLSQRTPYSSSPADRFGASATVKISIDGSFAGAIIGRNGVNSKQISRQTGVKLSVRDDETDPSKKSIELQGTFDQIKEASAMVRELMANVSASSGRGEMPRVAHGYVRSEIPNQMKTKMCEKFPRGLCTFGDRCHFAHSVSELRQ